MRSRARYRPGKQQLSGNGSVVREPALIAAVESRIYHEAARGYQRDHYRGNRQWVDLVRTARLPRPAWSPWNGTATTCASGVLLRPDGDACERERRTGSCDPVRQDGWRWREGS